MWTTKKALQIENARLRAELVAAFADVAQLRQYSSKMERLVDHERERIDAERERADRATDSLLQQNGLPPTTPIVLAENSLAEKEAERKFSEQQKMLSQLYSESMDDNETDEGLAQLMDAAVADVLPPDTVK